MENPNSAVSSPILKQTELIEAQIMETFAKEPWTRVFRMFDDGCHVEAGEFSVNPYWTPRSHSPLVMPAQQLANLPAEAKQAAIEQIEKRLLKLKAMLADEEAHNGASDADSPSRSMATMLGERHGMHLPRFLEVLVAPVRCVRAKAAFALTFLA